MPKIGVITQYKVSLDFFLSLIFFFPRMNFHNVFIYVVHFTCAGLRVTRDILSWFHQTLFESSAPPSQPLSYPASPSACLDTLKLLCVWAGEMELLFRSYLQGSDIRQLFPRKLTLHIKREQGEKKKRKKKTRGGCLRQDKGKEEKRTRELPRKIKTPACTSLPRKLFLFSNKAVKDEGDQPFPVREKLI